MTSLLRVENLSVCYGEKRAVDDVTFRVNAGEWWMIAGPNGAGKSTLAGALARTRRYTGEIFLDEVEIRKYKYGKFARKVGILSQNNASLYGFTVEEVVSLGRYAWRSGYFRGGDPAGEEKIREALALTGLTEMRGRSMLTLSGGESQRVFLAQALAQDPKLLMLDEPANHLDLPYQQQLVSVIGEWLKTPGRAVITVTHDLTMARQYGTHTLLMREGRCVAQGETEAVMTPENLEKVYEIDVAQIMRAALRAWL